MKGILPILFLFTIQVSFGQFEIQLAPTIQGNRMELNSPYKIDENTIELTKFELYLSNLEFYEANGEFSEFATPILLNEQNDWLKTIPIDLQDLDSIYIGLGIDSLTNVSGAMTGDLDPIYGMYWTWQSGYINIKLEGNFISQDGSIQQFQYHIGGYNGDQNTYSTFVVRSVENKKLEIVLSIDTLIGSWDIEKNPRIMRPGELAKEFAEQLIETLEK